MRDDAGIEVQRKWLMEKASGNPTKADANEAQDRIEAILGLLGYGVDVHRWRVIRGKAERS